MGQSCCAQHTFDTHELDNLARTRYMKTHPNCEIETELTSLSSELLEIAMRKTLKRKRKLILITSATSPIGRALCCEFASKSSEYIVCGISPNTKHVKQMTDDLDKICSTINTLRMEDGSSTDSEDDDIETSTSVDGYDHVLAEPLANIQCVDVCNEKKVALWIMDIFEEYGIPDMIINNSTIIEREQEQHMSYSQFMSISDRNVTAYFHLLKYVMPSLIKRKSGIIINLMGTSHSIPTVFKTAYNASKFAMEGYVESISNKLFKNAKQSANPNGQRHKHNKNISFVTLSVGSLDVQSQRIFKQTNEDTMAEALLQVKQESVTFQSWATKTLPIITALFKRNKSAMKGNKYTNVDRIIDLNTMLKSKYAQ
eukprot:77907_1